MLAAMGCEIALPWAARGLVNAVTAPRPPPPAAWIAWGLFVGAFLGFAAAQRRLPHGNPLAARNMEEMTNEGFRRVQGFSADWHVDTFAGATVRRLSRGAWGYDQVSDAVVLWCWPRPCCCWSGSRSWIAMKWSLIGGVALLVIFGSLGLNLWLVKVYVRPANLRSNAGRWTRGSAAPC